MSLRFHEIAETTHRLLNPFSEAKLLLLGDLCRLRRGMRLLDLACGKGELLCRFAERYEIVGVGVDISVVFLDAARDRAHKLDVWSKVQFVQEDAAAYPQEHHEYDIVSCIGATWIGGGLVGTLALMKTALRPDGGLLLVGEPYWIDSPPYEAYAAMDVQPDEFATLDGTLDRFEEADVELVEMVLSNSDDWDRYEAAQWWAIYDWLEANGDDPEADSLREWNANNRRVYLTYGRRYLNWGVFVLRV